MIYYVYILFDWNGVPFYIGKGKGRRWQANGRDVNRLAREVADKTIAILSEVPKIKIREQLTETEAYQVEESLITAIGRRPLGPLTNRTSKRSGTSAEGARAGGLALMAKLTRRERQQRAQHAIKQYQENSTPEERTDRMRRAWITRRVTNSGVTNHNNLGSKWINDGVNERRLPAGQVLPDEWSFGQLKLNRKPRQERITSEERAEIGRRGAMKRWYPDK